MYPNSQYPRPVSSFRKPAPIIAIDPDENPDMTVCFRSEWLPYIIGSLRQLLLQSSWDTTDENELNRARGQAQLLINMFIDGCGQGIGGLSGDLEGEFDVTALCEVLRWHNGVLQALCCGEWTNISADAGPIPGIGGQVPPQSTPAIGTCTDFNVTLQARDKWLLPFPLNAGDTVQITNPQGGWSDGTFNWYCPTGAFYTLGACGTGSAPVGSDPIPSISHMRLIGQLGTTAGAGFVDMISSIYTVAPGVVNQQFTLQANDSTLSDNQGSITFKVTVCRANVATWLSINDFANGQLQWTPYTCAGDCGNGCNSGAAASFSSNRFNSVIFACSNQRWDLVTSPSFTTSYIASLDIVANSNNAYSGSNGINVLYHDGTGWHGMTAQALISGTNTYNIPIGHNADQVRVSLFDQTALTMVAYVSKVTINGQGTKPSQLI